MGERQEKAGEPRLCVCHGVGQKIVRKLTKLGQKNQKKVTFLGPFLGYKNQYLDKNQCLDKNSL